jgi:hypothetical protein
MHLVHWNNLSLVVFFGINIGYIGIYFVPIWITFVINGKKYKEAIVCSGLLILIYYLTMKSFPHIVSFVHLLNFYVSLAITCDAFSSENVEIYSIFDVMDDGPIQSFTDYGDRHFRVLITHNKLQFYLPPFNLTIDQNGYQYQISKVCYRVTKFTNINELLSCVDFLSYEFVRQKALLHPYYSKLYQIKL